MKISIYRSLTDAFGYGWRRYDRVARIAWLPLFLMSLVGFLLPYIYLTVLTGAPVTIGDVSPREAFGLLNKSAQLLWEQRYWEMVGLQAGFTIVNLFLLSTFMVPLLRNATRGVTLPKTSFSLPFGFKHLRFWGAALISGLGLYFLLVMPMDYAVIAMSDYVDELLAQSVYVFPFEDSLHTVEEQPLVENPGLWQAIPGYIQIPFQIVLVYLGIRLFAYPVFVTAHEKSDGHSAFGQAWRLTRGLNLIRLPFVAFLLFVLFNGFHWFGVDIWGLGDILNKIIFPFILTVINSGFALAYESSRITGEANQASDIVLPIFQWMWAFFRIGLTFAYLILFYGIVIGFSASLYRQQVAGKV